MYKRILSRRILSLAVALCLLSALLPTGTRALYFSPAADLAPTHMPAIAQEAEYTAVIAGDGILYLHGRNIPEETAMVTTDAKGVAIGVSMNSLLVLKSDNSLWQLNDPESTWEFESHTLVKRLDHVAYAAVYAGNSSYFTCYALDLSGNLYYWGGNGVDTPTLLANDIARFEIDHTYAHGNAVKRDGDSISWNASSLAWYAELRWVDNDRVGVQPDGTYRLDDVTATDVNHASFGSGCYQLLKNDGSLWVYGGDFGTSDSEDSFVYVPSGADIVGKVDAPTKIMENVIDSRAGSFQDDSWALKADGTWWTWGCVLVDWSEDDLQYYLNDPADRNEMTPSKTEEDVARVVGSLLQKTDGSVWGYGWDWDENSEGGEHEAIWRMKKIPDAVYPVAVNSTSYGRASKSSLYVDTNGALWDYSTGKKIVDNYAEPTTSTHTITATAGVGGSISPSGTVRVPDGDSRTFTMRANSGYKISDVKLDGVSVGAVSDYTFENVTADHTLSVTFELTSGGTPTPTPTPTPVPVPVPLDVDEILKDITDVPDVWYRAAVAEVMSIGLMNGTGDGKFSPDNTLTRGMFVTILYRLAGEPAIDSVPDFADVKSGDWYSDAVAWAVEHQIAEGDDSGGFGVTADIDRQSIVVFLYRFLTVQDKLGAKLTADLTVFPDSGAVADWANNAVVWAVANETLTGNGTGLNPNGTATRAEAAAILVRVVHFLDSVR